ncbi:MAG: hypothetical protein ACYS47_12730 [Planctomycetota bacterium]|jgi:hypothetical protein
MKRCLAIVLTGIIFLSAPAAAREPTASRKVLEVLLVTPEGWKDRAGDWVRFLDSRGVKAVVAGWPEERARRKKRFDLVILAGPGRRASLAKAHLDFGEPVLGLGPYGCKVFGKFKLKHGHPYT